MGVKLVSATGGSVELVAPVTANAYSVSVPAANGTVTLADATNTANSAQFYATNGLFVNNQTVSNSYTLQPGQSALSAGPMAIAGGVTVTLSANTRWAIV